MAVDWSKIWEKYKGMWVALAEDETTVVGVGQTAREASDQAEQGGHVNPILTRMPERLVTYVGFGL
ncbi:MAG: hypothetical protein HYV42_05710 [Candidatus Magasanikbacteria bacterium]|nr:hypothetical protein [Candidatus Magasanikbacteria bacterium]